LAPSAGRILSFVGSIGLSPAGSGAITTANGGNLAASLSPFEALGIWNSPDFRFFPANVFHAGVFAAFALGVLLLGVAWSIGRRELVLPAAVTACAIIYWRSNQGQSPYVTAKALVIAGPVVAVTGMRGLLRKPQSSIPPWASLSRTLLAIAFVVFALHSTYETLRNEPVWAPESTSELIALDRLTRGQTVLFLGATDYASWLFHDSQMSALAANSVSMGQARARATKPNTYGTAFDFDSVDSSTLNQFDWVITPNNAYASQPPAAYRLARTLALYQLWHRAAAVLPREALDSAGTPGAVLNCRTPEGRALSRSSGVAAVMAKPLVVSMTPIPVGATDKLPLRLPPGTWDLSLQYESPVGLTLAAAGRRWTMPAYTDRPGPEFRVGSVTSDGSSQVVVSVHAARPSSLTGPDLAALTSALIAVRTPGVRALIPLRNACGRYVDWYRRGGPAVSRAP
jgi:hypothetical protein